MKHIWTTITTHNTITHDAGEPEWLDLPLSDFVLDVSPDVEELPFLQELDPPWLIQSRWLIEEIDVGRPLLPILELRDPLGFTLFNEVQMLDGAAGAFTLHESSNVSTMLVLDWRHVWYTVPGAYEFIVRWAGSPATRESGQFSIIITEPEGGGNNE